MTKPSQIPHIYPPRRTVRHLFPENSVSTPLTETKTFSVPSSPYPARRTRRLLENQGSPDSSQLPDSSIQGSGSATDTTVEFTSEPIPESASPTPDAFPAFSGDLSPHEGQEVATDANPSLLAPNLTPADSPERDAEALESELEPEALPDSEIYERKIAEQSEIISLAPRSNKKRSYVKYLVVALLLVTSFVVGNFALKHYYVSSTSMVPTMTEGSRLVEVFPFIEDEVVRGQIVIFDDLEGWMESGSEDAGTENKLIKRVIGVPGDTVTGNSRGEVAVNGIVLEEPYLNHAEPITYNDFSVTVPQGRYFVMGDNRLYSSDSRDFGTISAEAIIGTPDYITDSLFNFSKWEKIVTPVEVFSNIPLPEQSNW